MTLDNNTHCTEGDDLETLDITLFPDVQAVEDEGDTNEVSTQGSES